MTTAQDLQQITVKQLGFAGAPGFTPISWQGRREIAGVNAAYLIQGTPVVYFSQIGSSDPERLWRLYREVWNDSKVPLLYVFLPQEIRIYNVYAEPPELPSDLDRGDRLLERLTHLSQIAAAEEEANERLHTYDRLHMETGAFWSTPQAQCIKSEKRADVRLLRSLDQARRHLQDSLPNEVAYALLARSIFIRYLEDRGILNKKEIARLTNRRARSYLDALSDQRTTYLLFDRLSRRFNGDLFPVGRIEKEVVRKEHLNLLRRFLDGTDLDANQPSFWPYDFRFVPIEMISAIYDTFLKHEDREKTGTYYTPMSLVDFVLDETLPLEAARSSMKVLDPACGSGVFLVKAYQRLADVKQRESRHRLSADDLKKILEESIFGVDVHSGAVRIAAFSLYLALLDHLEDWQIEDRSFQFPSLTGNNLFIGDFFSPDIQDHLSALRFDRVVGNPPWGRTTLTVNAERWLKARSYSVADKQIVQAFLMAAPEICAPDGEVALLAPAKSTILVAGRTHREFRRFLFEHHNVRAVVNFSALVYELFAESLNPAVAIFYSPGATPGSQKITYAVPKPSELSRQLKAIVLDATEVKYLDQEDLLENPEFWKVALWGTARDGALIRRLLLLPSLEKQAAIANWRIGEGFFVGNKSKKLPDWLSKLPYLPVERFQRYVIAADDLAPTQEKRVERGRTRDTYRGPLALIHHSPTDGRCSAAFCPVNVAFRHSITGVSGQPGQVDLLKWLVAYINSPLAQYFHFLTSTRWAVERGSIIQDEYKRMPFLLPDANDSRFQAALGAFDEIAVQVRQGSILQDPTTIAEITRLEGKIADAVFSLYGLTPAERQLVQDMVEYGIEYFRWSKQKGRRPMAVEAVRPPDEGMLRSYANAFIETLAPLLEYRRKTLNGHLFLNGAPLSVISFELAELENHREVEVVGDAAKLRHVLRELDNMLLAQQSPKVYMRRHVTIYDKTTLYLVRPSEKRFWTRSQARSDADSVGVGWIS